MSTNADGNWIASSRKAAGLTQKVLAERLGITVVYMSYLETGARPLTTALRTKIAYHCGSKKNTL